VLTLLLIAILLTLLFGSAWLRGLFRNLALFAALFCAAILLKQLGVPLETAFYVGLGLLAVLGGAATYWMNKVEAERKGKIAAARKRPENMNLRSS
tara:strand:+ start:438 stop:725 length:288 start_codon:yes stop_codon:yes gene_type:complete